MKIDFEFETQYGTYRDALYFEDTLVPSDAELEVLKQQRVDNWIAVITAPQPVISKFQRDETGNLILDENGEPILNSSPLLQIDSAAEIIPTGA